jgi:nucleoside-diphosphate-sugar epimerase
MPRTAKHAVVTGAGGFIGSHLCEALVADGWRVTGIDAFTDYYDPADKEANVAGLVGDPDFDLVRGDLVDIDLPSLLLDQPLVVHLAAQPGVRGSFGEGFLQYVHDNVLATQRVFDAALSTGCRRVVYASSSSVYGEARHYPCPETAETAPTSPYGVTKLTCERLADVYRRLGLETVGLRYFTVYGPRQRPDMAVRRLCEAALHGQPFVLHGDGSASRDFTFVADAVAATVAALTAPDPGRALNIGGGHEATMMQVVQTIEILTDTVLCFDRGPVQAGDVRRTAADTTRARDRLGWMPGTDLVDGLAAQLSWVSARAVSRLPESLVQR